MGEERSEFSRVQFEQARKSPALGGAFFQAGQCRLDNLNFLSLHAFLTTGGHEGNLLAFFQALETIALNGFEVYEEVVTGLRGDEAVAFLIVEPLNGASLTIGHVMSPNKSNNSPGKAQAGTECNEY
jgi:hypothetical protein